MPVPALSLALVDEEPASAIDASAYVDRVREQLRTYLAVTQRPQTDASRAIGLSDSVISQWLNGKYRGDNMRVAHSIDAWLQVESRRLSLPNEPMFVETQNAKEIISVLGMCQQLCDLGMIYGAAGSGKSRTAKQYRRDHGDTVILVTADHAVRSPYAFVAQLASEIGVPTTEVLHKMRDRIIDKLKASRRLVIVDEAQKLTYNSIEMARSVYDKAEIGLVFLGDEVLWNTVTAGRTRPEYARLLSRVGFRRAINPGIGAEDVARIAAQYLGHTEQECIRFLTAKAGGIGGIRSVVKHCERACYMAHLDGRHAVILPDLEAAAAMRKVDERDLVAVK